MLGPESESPHSHVDEWHHEETWYQYFTPYFETRYWLVSNILLRGRLSYIFNIKGYTLYADIYAYFDVETLGWNPVSKFPHYDVQRKILEHSSPNLAIPVEEVNPPAVQLDKVSQSYWETLSLEKGTEYVVKTVLHADLKIIVDAPVPGSPLSPDPWPSDSNGNPLDHYAEFNFGEDDQNPSPMGNYVDCYTYIGPIQEPTGFQGSTELHYG